LSSKPAGYHAVTEHNMVGHWADDLLITELLLCDCAI